MIGMLYKNLDTKIAKIWSIESQNVQFAMIMSNMSL